MPTKSWQLELRSLLILGRVSNLPTVWSNCLAGWLLGGTSSFWRFALLCIGSSCLYIGGMFLNDAFDSEFDHQYRKERPIPTGAMSVAKVWGWGFGWLFAGTLALSLLGHRVFILALLLVLAILVYDAVHKAITLSPLLMALCRFLLYLLAAAASSRPFQGSAVWSGLALAGYVVGLSYLARGERSRKSAKLWPCLLLFLPLGLAWIVNDGEYRTRAIWFSLVVTLWLLYCLREAFWSAAPNVGRTVSGLLAGICLIDLLAVAGGTPLITSCFLAWFLLALACQRFIPAT